MGTKGIAPAVDIKTEVGWKRLFIKAAGFGAGFAIFVCAIVGFALWESSRPKPWNHALITAEYDGTQTIGDKNHIQFFWVLVNHSNRDYRIDDDSQLLYEATLEHEKALSALPKGTLTLHFPVFVPANGRAWLGVELDYAYPEHMQENATLDERKAFNQKVENFFSSKAGNIQGFELLDEERRIAIDLPGKWNSAK
jgi:hypothetical protein